LRHRAMTWQELEDWQEKQQTFAKADKDQSARMDFDEFVLMRCNRGVSRDDLRAVFDRLDGNGDGTLSFEEFAKFSQEEEARRRREEAEAARLRYASTYVCLARKHVYKRGREGGREGGREAREGGRRRNGMR
jgi:hypothetical protein